MLDPHQAIGEAAPSTHPTPVVSLIDVEGPWNVEGAVSRQEMKQSTTATKMTSRGVGDAPANEEDAC